MAHYPQPNFNAMRQDAIRRSREMQRRAAPKSPSPETSKPASYIAEAPSAPTPPSTFQGKNKNLPKELQSLLSGWDGERLGLLALLYLLYKDGADPKLLLAIAYIML